MYALVSGLCVVATLTAVQAPPPQEALRIRVEQLHEAPATSVRGVRLLRPDAVLIVYWTVTVGASGESRYARDVYNQDGRLRQALDALPGPPGAR